MARIKKEDAERLAALMQNADFQQLAKTYNVGAETLYNALFKNEENAAALLCLAELTSNANAGEYTRVHYNGTDETEKLQTEYFQAYAKISNPFAREQAKTGAEKSEALRAAGITRRALDAIDRNGSATRYRGAIEAEAAALYEAINKHAPADKIAQILARLNKAQNGDNINTFTAQLDASREELEAAIKARPDYTETAWQLYSTAGRDMLQRTYYKARKISFAPGAVSIIAAPTNHGKTTFLMATALQLAQSTKKTYLYISTEEDLQQMYIRALAAYIGDAWPLMDQYNHEIHPRTEIRNFIKAGGADLPEILRDGSTIGDKTADYWRNVAPYLRFSYNSGADIDALKYSVTEFIRTAQAGGEEIGGVFIDYLQMIHKAGRNFSRTEEIKDVCDGLNDLAKVIGVPLILAAQLNRNATNTAEYLDGVDVTNLGESAGIERIAHDLYLLWQTNKITDYAAARANDATTKTPRLDRCTTGSGSDRTAKPDFYYIENIKARDYKAGAYCLVHVNGAAGSISTETEHE